MALVLHGVVCHIHLRVQVVFSDDVVVALLAALHLDEVAVEAMGDMETTLSRSAVEMNSITAGSTQQPPDRKTEPHTDFPLPRG